MFKNGSLEEFRLKRWYWRSRRVEVSSDSSSRPFLNRFIAGQTRNVLKFVQQNLRNILGPYQSNSFTMLEPPQSRNGIGEYQQNMVFIALTIGEEMDYVPILSTEHVKFQ